MEQYLLDLAIRFADVVGRNTISTISNKMRTAKEKKDLKEQANMYTEIINELVSDKEELITIANEYKSKVERVMISDEDIVHLQNTCKNVLETISQFSPSLKGDSTAKSLNTLIELLNKDTLKTMQLLGFNYKEAIGQPLTELCADKIASALSKKTSSPEEAK